jgi:RNA polymerase sigma-70 factor (ECF subfamily)
MTELAVDRAAPKAGVPDAHELEARLETYRQELTAYCYRMLGSAFEAEDAVQETLIRAWRGFEGFEGRSALRSWLYRIATNVCLNMRGASQRRARPMDLQPASSADMPLGGALPEATWVEPIPDDRAVPSGGDPADIAVARESIRLAFITALQRLPPRQRAVLILREVLHWKASEVAELLETSVASVNSALQRARATLAEDPPRASDVGQPLDDEQRALLARYVDAFERYDMDSLTALLHEDATWNMPPYELWLQTHRDIVDWCIGPGFACRGSRLVATMANGSPAFGQYKPAAGGGYEAWSIQVLEISGDRISGVTFFLDTPRFFPLFGLPLRLDA